MKILRRASILVIFTALVCIAGLNLIVMSISKTYSHFNTSKSTALIAKVATSQDIIKSARVDNLNAPTKIIITKSKECKSNPIVYFELTGRLRYYVQHINPIELNDVNVKVADNKKITDADGNYIYEIPISVKVNSDEYNHFNPPYKPPSDVDGSIIVRYLDNYINLPIENVKYSVKYLNDNYSNNSLQVLYNFPRREGTIKEIKDISIDSPADANPADNKTPYKITITTNKNFNTRPTLYFELTGQLPYFIQHINPITLSSDKEIYEIPVYIKVNINDIKGSTFPEVQGDIFIKSMDNTYSKSLTIRYSSKNILGAKNNTSLDPEIKK